MNLKERAKKLKMDIPAVFIAMKKKETPLLAKVIAVVAVVYALSPIDLIPDFIPVLGYLDDLIILPALIAFVVKLIPDDIFSECRIASEGMWKDGKPQKWYYAIPVVSIWILIIWIILSNLIFK